MDNAPASRKDPRNAAALKFSSDFRRWCDEVACILDNGTTGKQISEADDGGCAWEQYCSLQSAAEFVREWC